MKADAATRDAVEATIQKMADAYKARNLKDMMACFAPDEDVTLIGTDADEKRIGLAEIQKQAELDWAQTESIELSFSSKAISAAGPVAWAFVEGTFSMQAAGQSTVLAARVTFVLENRGGEWLIVHAHFSTPAGGQ